MVASLRRSRWERRRQSLKIKLMEAGSSIRAVLQGGTDPADVWRAWSPSWWDTPKPRQEPAIPTQTSSLQTCSITSSKANWAENPDPSASCLQELPASLHGCCQHGPGLGQEQHLHEREPSQALLAEGKSCRHFGAAPAQSLGNMRSHDQPL